MEKKKDHADFQDEYSQSSNFGKEKKGEMEIKGDGELKLEKDDGMKEKEQKETVRDVLEDLNDESE